MKGGAKFKSDMARAKKNIANASEKTIRGSAIDLFKAIIKDTPVISGRLRDNWQATIGRPAFGTLPVGTESATINAAADKANEYLIGDRLYLTNNMEYANKIENGVPSGQRPQGMVAVNIAKFQSAIEKLAKVNKV